MSEIRTLDSSSPEERWVLPAIARDAHTVEQWQDALDGDGIDSEVRIEDAVLTGRSSTMPGTNAATGHELFSYTVWVLAADRETAGRALIDGGWDGNYSQRDHSLDPRFVLRGALIALAIAAVLIIIQMART
jgi:hypothetical protein